MNLADITWTPVTSIRWGVTRIFHFDRTKPLEVSQYLKKDKSLIFLAREDQNNDKIGAWKFHTTDGLGIFSDHRANGLVRAIPLPATAAECEALLAECVTYEGELPVDNDGNHGLVAPRAE